MTEEKLSMNMKMTMENVHRVPPRCVENPNNFSCNDCDYRHDDGEDGGGFYCEHRDTHMVF